MSAIRRHYGTHRTIERVFKGLDRVKRGSPIALHIVLGTLPALVARHIGVLPITNKNGSAFVTSFTIAFLPSYVHLGAVGGRSTSKNRNSGAATANYVTSKKGRKW